MVFINVAATSMAEPSTKTGNCRCYSNNNNSNDKSHIIRQNIPTHIIVDFRILSVKLRKPQIKLIWITIALPIKTSREHYAFFGKEQHHRKC